MKRHIVSILLTFGVFYWAAAPSKTGGAIKPLALSIDSSAPEWVLIGNSVLRAGIDPKKLQKKWGRTLEQHTSNGSASAYWYLYVKNVLGSVYHPPKGCLIFFRDTELTDPKFRTEGTYLKPLRLLAQAKEPDLASKIGSLNSPRGEFLQAWKKRSVKVTADLFGVSKGELREAIEETFNEEKMRRQALTQKQLKTEEVGEDAYAFTDRVELSFLPDILRELKRRGIQPLFVRHKRVRDAKRESAPEALEGYLADLKGYLEGEGALYLDLSDSVSLTEDLYGAGDHLNDKGKKVATKELSKRLKTLR